MDADEKEIVDYLKSMRGQFISGREIARRAGGKRRHAQDPNWASTALVRLVEKGMVESDSTGHYRLPRRKHEEPRKWISPQMKQILEKSGKDFTHVINEADTEDF
jgi:hypothetical protein